MTNTQNTAGAIKTILSEKDLNTNTDFWIEKLNAVTPHDVELALKKPAGIYDVEKLTALISPAAENYLEQMAQLAHKLTIQRFGKTIKLYAPLYLSNYCVNSCLYCGFNRKTDFQRTRLTIEQALKEADIIASEGFTDLLLVSSEDKQFITTDYLCELAKELRKKFSFLSIEIYQAEKEDYAKLFKAGIEGVTLYQETYDSAAYAAYHPAGPKSDYEKRLTAPDDMASAGMRQIGLGSLLGLTDWRLETLALAEHAHYLMKHYWKSQISFSFPRLRPAYEVEKNIYDHLISDKNLAQMIMALRLCFADAGLVLSTRESAHLRDNFVNLGITRISAGSKTNPGGYADEKTSVKQFEVDDDRTPKQISEMLEAKGFDPVWKDWDASFIAD